MLPVLKIWSLKHANINAFRNTFGSIFVNLLCQVYNTAYAAEMTPHLEYPHDLYPIGCIRLFCVLILKDNLSSLLLIDYTYFT